jgi:hypothetical protein
VLCFPVLDDQVMARKVSIHRKSTPLSVFAWIAHEGRESMLPAVVSLSQNLGNQIEDVLLVAFGARRHEQLVLWAGGFHGERFAGGRGSPFIRGKYRWTPATNIDCQAGKATSQANAENDEG